MSKLKLLHAALAEKNCPLGLDSQKEDNQT
jgi:hypothetical protein